MEFFHKIKMKLIAVSKKIFSMPLVLFFTLLLLKKAIIDQQRVLSAKQQKQTNKHLRGE
jgi:hypothetical protein